MRLFRLWQDDRGEVTSVAVLLLYSVLGIGAIVGLVCLRNQIVQEFGDLSVALDHLDQSYSVDFTNNCPDYSFQDSPNLTDPPGQPPAASR